MKDINEWNKFVKNRREENIKENKKEIETEETKTNSYDFKKNQNKKTEIKGE